jgi:single-strand DNA-binding protein
MNKITIIGNLTRDPEVRTTQTGINVCTFSVAVNRKGRSEGTDYFRVTCWRGLADIAGKYLSKGKKVAVIGQVTIGSYRDRNGEMHRNLEVTADDIELLSPRDADQEHQHQQQERESIQNEQNYTAVETDELPF